MSDQHSAAQPSADEGAFRETRTSTDDEDTDTTPESPSRRRFSFGRASTEMSLVNLGLIILIIVLFVVLLYLIFNAWFSDQPEAATDTPNNRTLILSDSAEGTLGAAAAEGQFNAMNPEVVPTLGPLPSGYAINPRFLDSYEDLGGLRLLGLPISPLLEVNGREVQWFERARLEHWPELAGTGYEIQMGRVGVEYTRGREFPEQTFFASQPGLRYFPETEHGVGEPFLSYWQQNGGLRTFGYPISEAFNEMLADNSVRRVQYFERARLEHHPDLAGTAYEVQVGLLGQALLENSIRPDTIPPAPTAVPLP